MKIFQFIAMNLQKGLNALATANKAPIAFSVKDMYDYIEPSTSPTKICGIVTYSSEDILPISGLDILTAPATVTFTCVKEMAYEVSSFIEAYVQQQKGVAVKIGEYTGIPTFSTPTRSDIIMVGQLGEAIEVSFMCSYVLIKNGILANQVNVSIDGKALGITSFEIGKTRSCPASNQQNNETVRSSAQTQTIGFTFTAVLTESFDFLTQEILAMEFLSKTHTLVIGGLGEDKSYSVLMQSGTVQGQMGGALMVNMEFIIAKEDE